MKLKVLLIIKLLSSLNGNGHYVSSPLALSNLLYVERRVVSL